MVTFLVKACFFDGYECPYSSCSFLQDSVVRLCHRHRGSFSAFHERHMVKPVVVSVIYNKHSGRGSR